MKVSSVLTIFLLIAAVSMTTVSARAWQVGDNGLSRWDFNCDFNGRDIRCVPAAGDQCGGVCIANPSCTHFTYSGGTCCIKRSADLGTNNSARELFAVSFPVAAVSQFKYRRRRTL